MSATAKVRLVDASREPVTDWRQGPFDLDENFNVFNTLCMAWPQPERAPIEVELTVGDMRRSVFGPLDPDRVAEAMIPVSPPFSVSVSFGPGSLLIFFSELSSVKVDS